MKTPILALAVALLPFAAFAQSDKPKQAIPAAGAEVAEVDIKTAQKLLADTEAAQNTLYEAAKAFASTLFKAKDGPDLEPAAAQALEIAGVKLESFYDKAVHLRIKPAAGGSPALAGMARGARGVAATAAMPAALRLKLAQEQIVGGDAALDAIGYKIGRAQNGAASLLPDYIVDRLLKAAVAVSQAHAALNAALGPRAGAAVDAPDAAKPEPARTGGGK